jgi:DNA-binding CsgD family transcriptional regulator
MVHELINYNQSINSLIRDIAEPFMRHFNFNHLLYAKLIGNDKRLYLSTNLEWVNTYIENKLFEDQEHNKTVIYPTAKRKLAFFAGFHGNRVFKRASYFGMWHGAIVYDNNEIFGFTTNKDNVGIINRCLSNSDLLDHFIFYFHDKARQLTQPHTNILLSSGNEPGTIYTAEQDDNDLRNLMQIKSYYIKDKHGHEHKITPREAQTLQLLAEGKTFGEAAFVLKISTKTLEKYVESLKAKFNLFCRSKLVEIYHQTNLKNIVLYQSPHKQEDHWNLTKSHIG